MLPFSARSPSPSSPSAMRIAACATLLALGAGSVGLTACDEDATNETSQKRITLTVKAVSPVEARTTFTNSYQWTITLSKAALAVGAVYFFDGAPIFSWHTPARTPRQRLASVFVGTAHAHPGHYIAGNAVGQMLTPSSLSLLGDGVTLGTGDGVTGLFQSARVTFPETVSGSEAGALGDKIAVFEGVARKEGKNVGFRLTAVRSELVDADGQARVEGTTIAPASTIGGDATLTLVIDPRKFFDQSEFDGLPEGETPVDLPKESDASRNFVRGVKSGPAYVFTVSN